MIKLYRVSEEERDNVGLWFESKEQTEGFPAFVASIVKEVEWRRGKPYVLGVFGRFNSPKGRLPEIAFVGADFNKIKSNVRKYATAIERHYRRHGYNVKVMR